MKQRNWAWKIGAMLFAVLPAFDLVYRLSHSDFAPAHLIGSGLLLFAAVGSIQFAFGVPMLPRTLWRIFGPPFACLVAWIAAWTVGWLATRLAIRPLTAWEQLGTLATLLVFAGYGLIVVLPLYWLGEWQRVAPDQREALQKPEREGASNLWLAISAFIAVLPILPFYWFWPQISATPSKLILITGALLWVTWTWWKFAAGVASRIRADVERSGAEIL